MVTGRPIRVLFGTQDSEQHPADLPCPRVDAHVDTHFDNGSDAHSDADPDPHPSEQRAGAVLLLLLQLLRVLYAALCTSAQHDYFTSSCMVTQVLL